MAKILVVDDLRDLTESLALLFETLGHETRVAFDGREALAVAREFVPEIVFMDLDMPVLDGLEAARLIRAEVPTAPVLVAVTATAHPGVDAVAKAAGFDVCLKKPAEPRMLLGLVNRLTAGRPRGEVDD